MNGINNLHCPLVSVIIPVFNVERYLRQCLDSVIGQTYKNLEILIINDGSTDGCGKICDEYAKDKRVRVFHTENRGLSAARNLGLDNANGEYISFIDSDDWFEVDAIQRTVKVAEDNKVDIVCFRSVREYTGLELNDKEDKTTQFEIKTLCGAEIILAMCSGQIGFSVWNKIWRKRVFLEMKFPEGRNYEDIATTYKILVQAEKIVYIREIMVHYRARKGGITNNYALKNIQDYWTSCYECYTELLRLSTEYGLMQLRWCINAIGRMWRVYSGFTKGEKLEAQETLNIMQKFGKEHFFEALKNKYIPLTDKILFVISMIRNPISMRLLFLSYKIYKFIQFRRGFYE